MAGTPSYVSLIPSHPTATLITSWMMSEQDLADVVQIAVEELSPGHPGTELGAVWGKNPKGLLQASLPSLQYSKRNIRAYSERVSLSAPRLSPWSLSNPQPTPAPRPSSAGCPGLPQAPVVLSVPLLQQQIICGVCGQL